MTYQTVIYGDIFGFDFHWMKREMDTLCSHVHFNVLLLFYCCWMWNSQSRGRWSDGEMVLGRATSLLASSNDMISMSAAGRILSVGTIEKLVRWRDGKTSISDDVPGER